jgi:hypothetical protein
VSLSGGRGAPSVALSAGGAQLSLRSGGVFTRPMVVSEGSRAARMLTVAGDDLDMDGEGTGAQGRLRGWRRGHEPAAIRGPPWAAAPVVLKYYY